MILVCVLSHPPEFYSSQGYDWFLPNSERSTISVCHERQAIGISEQVNIDSNTKFCGNYTDAQDHTAVRAGPLPSPLTSPL